MRDFTHPLERLKRLICRAIGHRGGRTGAGESVVATDVVYCVRCGKFERSYWPKEAEWSCGKFERSYWPKEAQ